MTCPDVRAARLLHRYPEENGRSQVYLQCPWCDGRVLAYAWSLAGGGKKCPCGALLGTDPAGRCGLGYYVARAPRPRTGGLSKEQERILEILRAGGHVERTRGDDGSGPHWELRSAGTDGDEATYHEALVAPASVLGLWRRGLVKRTSYVDTGQVTTPLDVFTVEEVDRLRTALAERVPGP